MQVRGWANEIDLAAPHEVKYWTPLLEPRPSTGTGTTSPASSASSESDTTLTLALSLVVGRRAAKQPRVCVCVCAVRDFLISLASARTPHGVGGAPVARARAGTQTKSKSKLPPLIMNVPGRLPCYLATLHPPGRHHRVYASPAVQPYPDGGRFEFARSPARTMHPHGGPQYVRMG